MGGDMGLEKARNEVYIRLVHVDHVCKTCSELIGAADSMLALLP